MGWREVRVDNKREAQFIALPVFEARGLRLRLEGGDDALSLRPNRLPSAVSRLPSLFLPPAVSRQMPVLHPLRVEAWQGKDVALSVDPKVGRRLDRADDLLELAILYDVDR